MRHAPFRLAGWRMCLLDNFLRQVEELRLEGEKTLPEDLRGDIIGFAARHDAQLLDDLGSDHDANVAAIHEALFDAQGRVMMQLAELRRVPNWLELDNVVDLDEPFELAAA